MPIYKDIGEEPNESIKFGKFPIEIILLIDDKKKSELYISERIQTGQSNIIIKKILKENNVVITIEPEYHSPIDIFTGDINISVSNFSWLDFYDEGVLETNAVINIYRL